MFKKQKIEQLQLSLKSLDLYHNKIDGIIGKNTRKAIHILDAIIDNKPTVKKPQPNKNILDSTIIKLPVDSEGADIAMALIFTLKNEGGYVDHPNDRGGATNQGITIDRLSEYLGRDATKKEVKNLDYETITLIYKKYYWDAMNLDNIQDQGIATALFDMGVLCGTRTAIRLAQEILNIRKTKKMDKSTIDAINETTDEKFITNFSKRNIKRFKAIVANRISQKVFLKGWINRANRLLTLIHQDYVVNKSYLVEEENNIGKNLHQLAIQYQVPSEDIQKMIDWQKNNKPTSNPRYWVVFKIKKHSGKKRMYIFDRIGKKVIQVHATHGTGSDPDNNGLATMFSNENGSHKSSLGLYITAETYIGKHGKSLRLDGLEYSNNNARKRFIVFHGAKYAEKDFIDKNGNKCGRSWGCPAVGESVV